MSSLESPWVGGHLGSGTRPQAKVQHRGHVAHPLPFEIHMILAEVGAPRRRIGLAQTPKPEIHRRLAATTPVKRMSAEILIVPRFQVDTKGRRFTISRPIRENFRGRVLTSAFLELVLLLPHEQIAGRKTAGMGC